MLESILSSTDGVTIAQFLLLTGVSLGLGFLSALVYMYRNVYSKGFVLTLVLLPAMVQTVVLLVSGNLGAGIAVAGAFSLIRFRSAAGGAREIAAVFLATAIGLADGLGYLGVACLLFVVLSAGSLLLTRVRFGEQDVNHRLLKITMPEDLDYTAVFDDVFRTYTKSAELRRVKTTNLGSLFELQYDVVLRDPAKEKRFIDALRTRNGNLNILLARTPGGKDEL